MPVRSERANQRVAQRLARYPPDWPEISQRIRFDRAGGRCECTGQCGLHRGRRCVEEHGKPAKFARGKIVLTTMHLNHTPEDCRDENLLAGCQRCHLRYDRQHHRVSALEAAGQARLALEGA
jgi:hypothetical protein